MLKKKTALAFLVLFFFLDENLGAETVLKRYPPPQHVVTRGGASLHRRDVSALTDAGQLQRTRLATRTEDSQHALVPDWSVVSSGGASASLGLAAASFWRTHGTSVKFLVAGAVSGIVSRTCTSPLEVVATMQMCGKPGYSGGVVKQLRTLYREEGPMGFWKGNGANCLKVAPTRAIQFAVFEQLKLLVLKHHSENGIDRPFSPTERLVAGGIAGMVASFFVYPLEVVKTMLTMTDDYSGIVDAFTSALRMGGLSKLYQGVSPTLVAMFPYVGVEFMAYESLKGLYLTIVKSIEARGGRLPSHQETTFWFLMFGAGAGAAAQTLAHPLDVVRKILQLQGEPSNDGTTRHYSNMFDGLYWLCREKGWGAMYRGLRPACAATVPSTAITYVVYEFMKALLGITSL